MFSANRDEKTLQAIYRNMSFCPKKIGTSLLTIEHQDEKLFHPLKLGGCFERTAMLTLTSLPVISSMLCAFCGSLWLVTAECPREKGPRTGRSGRIGAAHRTGTRYPVSPFAKPHAKQLPANLPKKVRARWTRSVVQNGFWNNST
jgi:hypothetical protein